MPSLVRKRSVLYHYQKRSASLQSVMNSAGMLLVHNGSVWLASPSLDRSPWYLAHVCNVHIWHVHYQSRAVLRDCGFKLIISRRLITGVDTVLVDLHLDGTWEDGSQGFYQMQVFLCIEAKPSQEEISALPLPERLCFGAVGQAYH